MRSFSCQLLFGILLFTAGCATEKKHVPAPWDDGAPLTGAAAIDGKADVAHSPYFKKFDFYNTPPSKTLILLPKFKTMQQTTEYTCGAAAVRMVLAYWGMADKNERELSKELGIGWDGEPRTDGGIGCTGKAIEEAFIKRGCSIRPNQEFKDEYELANFFADSLKKGNPVLLEYIAWGGHWVVLIGYDSMGTPGTGDDILIFADPYDTGDHYQDGYQLKSLERFFAEWFDAGCLTPGITRQIYVAPLRPAKAQKK